MAKRKTPQELMKERNPLSRTAVAPIDIYHQPPEPVRQVPDNKPKAEAKNVRDATPSKTTKSTVEKEPKAQEETDSPYSTYLFKHQVKGIKLRAIEQGIKDKHVVQRAVDEYLKNHPL